VQEFGYLHLRIFTFWILKTIHGRRAECRKGIEIDEDILPTPENLRKKFS
jgi:hypothetical protein